MTAPDILILLCDTARADAFRPWDGPLPSPTIERLSREGLTFRRAFTAAPWTLPSTASIFSGLLPTEHRITAEWVKPRAEGRPEGGGDLPEPAAAAPAAEGNGASKVGARAVYDGPWLPESLTDRGYRSWAVSCNPWIASWLGFDRGFERFVDIHPWPGGQSRIAGRLRRLKELAGLVDHGGKRAFGAFSDWVKDADAAPWFAFVNLMELHDPYDPPPRYHPLFGAGRHTLPLVRAPQALAQQARQRHLRERPSDAYVRTIRALYYAAGRYEDRLLGEFVRAVEERDRPAIVVVVSDHGENLGEHGLFEHHSSLHETLLHVPLIVWGHGVDLGPGVIDDPVSLVGLRAWLERLSDGGDGPMTWEGPITSEYESTVERPQVVRLELQRWVEAEERGRVPSLYYHPGIAVKDGRYKYVAVGDGSESLYDLETDPGEERDVSGSQPDRLAQLRPHADAWRERRQAEGQVAEATSEDEEIQEHLRMLGYIE
jgi:arylsulfatase A-like enzyme